MPGGLGIGVVDGMVARDGEKGVVDGERSAAPRTRYGPRPVGHGCSVLGGGATGVGGEAGVGVGDAAAGGIGGSGVGVGASVGVGVGGGVGIGVTLACGGVVAVAIRAARAGAAGGLAAGVGATRDLHSIEAKGDDASRVGVALEGAAEADIDARTR